MRLGDDMTYTAVLVYYFEVILYYGLYYIRDYTETISDQS